MEKNKLSRRDFLRLTGTTSSAALLGITGLERVTGADRRSVPAQDMKTITCWLGEYHPTEWTERSAEHPTVVKAVRQLAEQFQQDNPNTQVNFVDYDVSGESDAHAAWLTARIASGDAPDLIWSVHNIPIQNHWALPIQDYLDQPNPYTPDYATWRDIFWPTLMTSLLWEDQNEYCAPIRAIWPYLEVGLAYNKAMFEKLGLKPPTTWTEEKEVAKALKEVGGGLSPWPPEGESGNCWPLALQILPPMMQSLCTEIDLNGDKFVGVDEALPAYKKGLIGPKTPIYRRAWSEMHELATAWVDGFNTTDLDALWRQGKIGMQYRATWEFSTLANDPTIEFEQGFLPAPMPDSKDIPATADMPGAADPAMLTAGDGTVPGDYITAVQGPDFVMLKNSVEEHGNVEETLKWWQFMTTPDNNAYMVNENQEFIPSARDAALGPLWQEVAGFKLPIYDYSIAWWGMGLYWDVQHFQNWRKLFVAWMTGQIDEATFFDRQEQEFADGAARYEASLGSAS